MRIQENIRHKRKLKIEDTQPGRNRKTLETRGKATVNSKLRIHSGGEIGKHKKQENTRIETRKLRIRRQGETVKHEKTQN